MSSALTTLENIRSPDPYYGAASSGPEINMGSSEFEPKANNADFIGSIYDSLWTQLIVHTVLRTPSTDRETPSGVTAVPASMRLSAIDTEQLYLSLFQWWQSAGNRNVLAGNVNQLRGLPRLIVEVGLSTDPASYAALIQTLPVPRSPGALLGDAWPSKGGQSIHNEAPPARRKLVTASDFSDFLDVDSDTINRAVACLNLLPVEIPSPQASPSPDGEIGFFWFNKSNRVEAYFDSEGNFTWIGKFDGHFDRGGDVAWCNLLPDSFVRMINKLYS